MGHKGFSHVGLSTLDLDKTREFFEKVLGFKVVIADTIKIKEGGAIRHIFFDTGRDMAKEVKLDRGGQSQAAPREVQHFSVGLQRRRAGT